MGLRKESHIVWAGGVVLESVEAELLHRARGTSDRIPQQHGIEFAERESQVALDGRDTKPTMRYYILNKSSNICSLLYGSLLGACMEVGLFTIPAFPHCVVLQYLLQSATAHSQPCTL